MIFQDMLSYIYYVYVYKRFTLEIYFKKRMRVNTRNDLNGYYHLFLNVLSFCCYKSGKEFILQSPTKVLLV